MNDQTAIVKAQATTPLAEIEFDPRLLQAAKAIQIMSGRKKNRDGSYGDFLLSDEAAIAAAVYQMGTGQLAGRDFYMNDKVGRMEGYRGAARDAADRGAGELQIEYRKLTPDELEENEVQPGDVAYACEVKQLRAWRIAQQLAFKQRIPCPYTPIVGIGIIREIEKFDKDTTRKWNEANRRYEAVPRNQWRELSLEGGMTWVKKARNRAYKDAMRHLPSATAGVNEIIQEGAMMGAELPPEDARLSPERAQAWVDSQLNAQAEVGEFRQLTEQEQRERFDANVKAMRGPKNAGLGDDPEPGGSDNHAPLEPSPDEMFDGMTSATEERAGKQAEPMVTPAQIKDLGILASKLYKTPEDMGNFKAWLKDQYGVESRKELTGKQAAQLTAELEAALKKAEGK